MKIKISILTSSLLLAGWSFGQNVQAGEVRQPNVIFLKTDDQRYDSLSMTGHPVTETPNIDLLAEEGVFFNKAFITSPICGPSRANFFTAQWERKNRQGFTMLSKNHISEALFDNSWQMKLKAAGYFTGYIGKHHAKIGNGKRKNAYMKENIDFCYLHEGHLGFNLHKKKVFQNLKHSSQIEGLYEASAVFLSPGNDKQYFFENADASVRNFLMDRDQTKPFALSINLNLPHASSIGGMGKEESDPEMYRSLYNDKKDQFLFPKGYPFAATTLPDSVFATSDLMGYYGVSNEKKLLDKKIKMARAVAGIDLMVGKLREELKKMKVEDNTIIVFASDHGLLLGEHGLGGKTFLYEESIQIPMIIYSPSFCESERGKKIDQLVVGQDIPPTILELCGIETPDTYQGVSTLPLIKGEDVVWRNDIFCENLFTMQGYPRMEAVRGEKWKYIRYFSKENDRDKYLPDASINGEKAVYEELFDLESDPKESNNLAGDKKYAEVLKKQRKRCQELVVEMAK
ncbi:MAG: sulfatase-like hydrolase/transferase [Akkermansiaceae bacterium]